MILYNCKGITSLSGVFAGRIFRGFAIFSRNCGIWFPRIARFFANREISFREFLEFFDKPRNLFPRSSYFEKPQKVNPMLNFCNVNDNMACFWSRIKRGRWHSWIKYLVFIRKYRKTITRKCRRKNNKNSKKEDKKVHILANICFNLWVKTITI